MARAPHVSGGHIVWAYDVHIKDKYDEGLTVTQIRQWLRDEFSLHVGREAVRAVLHSYGHRHV